MIHHQVSLYVVAGMILHAHAATFAYVLDAEQSEPGHGASSSVASSALSPAPVASLQASVLTAGGTGASSDTDRAPAGSAARAESSPAGGDPACGPGAGDCFTNNGTPGCEDEVCCNRVCDIDAKCCTSRWDQICVGEAEDLCGCAGEGNCFEANGTPSCSVESCCADVCAEDAYCCDTEWDCRCAEAASRLCGDKTCPGTGSCLADNATPGCDHEQCCNTVCLEDPECCDFAWDSICVSKAQQLCVSAAGDGNCMAANGTPGCDDSQCAGLVCAASPWCCEREWDAACATAAVDLCAQPNCPGTGDCLSAHETPGCADEMCCNSVCLQDPDCCLYGWDGLCADKADELCGSCPGSGDCDQPNATPGCADAACCETVCHELPLCCRVEWDAACATAAVSLCAQPNCPATGDCNVAHGTPGCADEACCNAVCLQDWECCALEWDSLCVDRAAAACGVRNDVADLAIPISCGERYRGSTSLATPDAEASLCGAGGAEPGVWYRVTGTGRDITIDMCHGASTYDTRISVFGGACPRSLTCVADNDNACGAQASVTWASNLGERYLVLVHGGGGESGDFELSVCCKAFCSGDFDGDGDTDLSDLARFMNCFKALDREPIGDDCVCADFDDDGRVDWEDYTEFLCAFDHE